MACPILCSSWHPAKSYWIGTPRKHQDDSGNASSDTPFTSELESAGSQLREQPEDFVKWRKRSSVEDVAMGPKQRRSTVLSAGKEALAVAFRKQTLLRLDNCLYTLQATMPKLTRSALHLCLQQHSISRMPEIEGDKPPKKKFRQYLVGYFHIDIAEVRTEQGKLYLLVAIDRTSKFTFVELRERATRRISPTFCGR